MFKRFAGDNSDKPNMLLNVVCFFLPLTGAIFVSPVDGLVVPCVYFIGAMAFLEFKLSTSRRDKSAAFSALLGFIMLCVAFIASIFVMPWED